MDADVKILEYYVDVTLVIKLLTKIFGIKLSKEMISGKKAV